MGKPAGSLLVRETRHLPATLQGQGFASSSLQTHRLFCQGGGNWGSARCPVHSPGEAGWGFVQTYCCPKSFLVCWQPGLPRTERFESREPHNTPLSLTLSPEGGQAKELNLLELNPPWSDFGHCLLFLITNMSLSKVKRWPLPPPFPLSESRICSCCSSELLFLEFMNALLP